MEPACEGAGLLQHRVLLEKGWLARDAFFHKPVHERARTMPRYIRVSTSSEGWEGSGEVQVPSTLDMTRRNGARQGRNS
ncbi:hypothetical protein JCM1841_005579 [Sporobolomyces salmonicolor]